jgi:hypothetical protein
MPDARTPDFIKALPQFKTVEEVSTAAAIAGRGVAEVTDEDSCGVAAEALTRISKAVKEGNRLRKEATAPYRDTTSLMNRLFGEMIGPLEGMEERLREEVASYERRRRVAEEEAKRQHEKEVRDHEAAVKKAAEEELKRKADAEEAQRKAEEAAAAGAAPPPEPDPLEEPAPPPPPPPPPAPARSGARRTSGGAVHAKTEWKFEVVDLVQVPHDLKMLDEKEVKKRIAAGERNIPGLRIYPDEKLRVT